MTSYHGATELMLDNISGHRDGNSSPSPDACVKGTACPGESLYQLLPGIRLNVDALISGGEESQSFTIYNDGNATLSVTSLQLQSSGSWISWSPSGPFSVASGGSQQVTVSVDLNAAPAGSSTRRLLVYSDDADESPYPGGIDIVVNTPEPPACYSLSRTHTGSGVDPTASPANSSACPAGQYVAGELIMVTADPASGWVVWGWTGTINDGSTSENNTVTMPASHHTVSVEYVVPPPPCYTLTLSHTGSGVDPSASPTTSVGCSAGYTANSSVQLTASPASGWAVAGWSGTDDDASTSTTSIVTMPAGNHTATVHYGELPIFQDGFESGNTLEWSSAVGLSALWSTWR